MEERLKAAREITPGPVVERPATSLENLTGGWRSFIPKIDIDKCVGCLNCWIYCPEGCITRYEDENKKLKVKINYDYCKGCGICAEVCPVKDCIIMERQ